MRVKAQDISNPYWEQLQTWARDEIAWKYDNRWEISWYSVPYEQIQSPLDETIKTRDDLVIEYAWSIPDPASLEFVAKHLGEHAIEIGAGTGYYASLLAQLGTEVICYDSHPPQLSTENHWCSPRKGRNGGLSGELRKVYREICCGGPEKAAGYPDFTLFLCWPPMSDMAYQSLKAYTGNKLVYIGEGNGGCTADEEFFELLDKHWEQIDEHRPIQWSGIHDWITIYAKKEITNVK